jgi:putative oxidoreductase
LPGIGAAYKYRYARFEEVTTERRDSLLHRFDHVAIDMVRRHGLLVLRLALGVVFLWFGALKLSGMSPVADLVADTLGWLPPEAAVRLTGGLEVLIGLGLITGWAIRVTMLLFFLQMGATLLVPVLYPERVFQEGNLLNLTLLGEFIVKNIVLITAGLMVASSIPKAGPGEPLKEMLTRPAGRRPER